MDKLSMIKTLLGINDEYLNIHGLEWIDDAFNPDDDTDVIKLDKVFIECGEKKCKRPTDLTVRPMVKEEDDYIKISDNLPKIPFSLLSCGSRGAGKSVITCCLLEWLHSYFDQIFIFSPTIELDTKYKLMFEKLDIEFEFGVNVFKDYDEGVLTSILSKIKRANKNKPFKDKARILFIYDDIISLLPKNKRRTNFNKLILNNRHFNISLIINSQSLKLFDSNFRKNCSQIILFRTDNCLELKNYWEEFSALLGNTTRERRENFMKIYNYATAESHSFLYINTHNYPRIFFKNFDELIDVPHIISQPLDAYIPDILNKKKII